MPLSDEKMAEMERKYGLKKNASTPATQVDAQVKHQLIQRPEGNIDPSLQPTTSEAMGTLANMLNTGMAGAEVGGMAGPMGAMAGGAIGAGAGAFMDPSQTPGMDAGSALGSLLASRVPGGGALMRMAKGAGGVLTGSTLGALADKKGDVQQMPWGKIAFYTGISAGSLAAAEATKAMLSPGPTYTAAQQLKETLGSSPATDIPLSLTDSLKEGGLRSALRYMTGGTDRVRELGKRQSDAGDAIMQKLVGNVLGEGRMGTVEKAGNVRLNLRDAVTNVTDQWKQATGKAPKLEDFASSFGVEPEEAKHIMGLIDADPQRFVNAFLPAQKKETNVRSLMALRTMSNMLPDEMRGKLGAGIIARLMDDFGAVQTTERGSFVSGDAFEKALSSFGQDRLTILFGKERAEALDMLARVMKTTDPVGKDLSSATAQTGPLKYLSNKMLFTIAGAGAGSLAGGHGDIGTIVGSALVGGGAAATVAVPIFSMISKIVASPATAKLLIAAGENSNGKAAAALARVLTSQVTQDKKVAEPNSTPATRMNGLFGR